MASHTSTTSPCESHPTLHPMSSTTVASPCEPSPHPCPPPRLARPFVPQTPLICMSRPLTGPAPPNGPATALAGALPGPRSPGQRAAGRVHPVQHLQRQRARGDMQVRACVRARVGACEVRALAEPVQACPLASGGSLLLRGCPPQSQCAEAILSFWWDWLGRGCGAFCCEGAERETQRAGGLYGWPQVHAIPQVPAIPRVPAIPQVPATWRHAPAHAAQGATP